MSDSLIASAGVALIVAGVLLDLASLGLGLRRLRGNGPSGVPIVGFLLMVAGIYLSCHSKIIPQDSRSVAVSIALITHLGLQFGILAILHLCLPLEGRRETDRGQLSKDGEQEGNDS